METIVAINNRTGQETCWRITGGATRHMGPMRADIDISTEHGTLYRRWHGHTQVAVRGGESL